jgi:hypothetical protein
LVCSNRYSMVFFKQIFLYYFRHACGEVLWQELCNHQCVWR